MDCSEGRSYHPEHAFIFLLAVHYSSPAITSPAITVHSSGPGGAATRFKGWPDGEQVVSSTPSRRKEEPTGRGWEEGSISRFNRTPVDG
ncbi:hypothetical protein SUGI_1503690 [Cryptomeria japonica]|uniref:Uncharacterized protein n=1 Tax=Cryptomeria japonica TaxID=3369 RepID=A0AAD3NTT5_CRYJA|nr:hypothetical protein SUGI_1503690 [Cryptomeria japonica]